MQTVVKGIKTKGKLNKTSELNLDETVRELLNSDFGILLLQSDNTNTDMYGLIANKCTYETKQGMYGDETHISYYLYNLAYHKKHKDYSGDESMCIETRQNAIHNVFCRWTEKGYNKRHAKNPFGCKAFKQYLDELHWNEADYMLLMVDK